MIQGALWFVVHRSETRWLLLLHLQHTVVVSNLNFRVDIFHESFLSKYLFLYLTVGPVELPLFTLCSPLNVSNHQFLHSDHFLLRHVPFAQSDGIKSHVVEQRVVYSRAASSALHIWSIHSPTYILLSSIWWDISSLRYLSFFFFITFTVLNFKV